MDSNVLQKYSGIISLVVIVIVVIVFAIVYGFGSSTSATKYNSQYAAIEEEIQGLKNQITQMKIGPPGPAGKAGPQGPVGPAGGTFTNQGPLRSLSQTNLVADRMYGNTPQSIGYLTENSYKPHQQWTLNSAGLVQNKYGGCLFGDTTTNSVYIQPCSSTNSKLNWIYDQNGRLIVKNDTSKCLTTSYVSSISGVSPITNSKQGTTTTMSDLVTLKLGTCDNTTFPTNQQWAFY